ncbi:PKD-like family lipoprotein [uncultured Sanguibacteroides sp.]|uniref:PKD-like family lipoprotein n=1 Tax=uncultured Sanguibacteroides sp. TaxID=1635151 RepID=UPI0025D88A01|nr:PKD-like family lipoprotein [uncultured Sanguibacteroides sp.]
MNAKIIRYMLACLFIVQACYDDKGNYDYIRSNGVTIALNPVSKIAYLGEIYCYDPDITFTNVSDSVGFEYWWEYTGSSAAGGAYDTICKTRTLNFNPQETGEVWVRLCVKEQRTGVVTTSDILALNVQSSYGKGWMILGQDNDRTTLSFVRPGYEETEEGKKRIYTPMVDLYEKIFPEQPLGTLPVGLRQMLTWYDGAIMVLQKNSPLYLNGNSYKKEVLLDDEFVGGIPDQLEVKDFFNGTNVDIVLDKTGKMYVRNFMNVQGMYQALYTRDFTNIPSKYKGEELHIDRVIPTRPMYDYICGLYDAENSRFLWAGVAYSASVDVVIPSVMQTSASEYIDLTDLDGWELVFCGTHTGGSAYGQPRFVAIFKKGDVVKAQTFTAKSSPSYYNASSVSIIDVTLRDFSGKKYISENTKYYTLKTRGYMFFAEKNIVYWYDLTTGESYPFYTFANENASVVAMSSNPQESELGVVLDDGVFATLNIENDKLYSGERIYEKSGFGKVIDIDYKYPNYNVYNYRTNANNAD